MKLLLPDQVGDCDAQRAVVQSKRHRAVLESFAGAMFPGRNRCCFRHFRRVAGGA